MLRDFAPLLLLKKCNERTRTRPNSPNRFEHQSPTEPAATEIIAFDTKRTSCIGRPFDFLDYRPTPCGR